MGKLRTNSNKDIARAASELVTKWKKLVEQEKKHKGAKVNSPAPAPSSSPNARAAAPATSTTMPASTNGAKGAKYTGNVETRKFESDGVDTKRTDSQVRNSCIGLIYNGLAYRSTESPSDVIARSVAVEQAAFTKYKGESNDYKKKIRSLFSNLKDKSNRELGLRVMAGTIPADKFVAMTDEELKSESLRKLDKEAEEENIKNAQVAKGEKSYSDSLECGRCKKKMVSYTQAQTRSADEPMTTFCECMNCGKRWKVRSRITLESDIGRLFRVWPFTDIYTCSSPKPLFYHCILPSLSIFGGWRDGLLITWKRSLFWPSYCNISYPFRRTRWTAQRVSSIKKHWLVRR